MRARAIKELAKLSDDKLFPELSRGMALCKENAQRLFLQSEGLGKLHHSQGCQILRNLAEEEASKVLILLDAARCPRSGLVKHLEKFKSHLARGIYARACSWRIGTYAELMHYISMDRQALYLDGPNDVDFIFRNEIEHSRESVMYVDYIETEEGCNWLEPSHWSDVEILGDFQEGMKPKVLEVAEALENLGCISSGALSVVANRWRLIQMTDDYSYVQLTDEIFNTLKDLEKNGLLSGSANKTCLNEIYDHWQFPVYSEELEKPIPVSRETLREKQRNWNPGWY